MRSRSPWSSVFVPPLMIALLSLLCCRTVAAQDLIVDNQQITLSGIHSYKTVQVINGGRIVVPAFDGFDRVNTGNLQLVAESIVVDAQSSIVADGAGYQGRLCDNGGGPGAGGGRGGCAVRDSGGGGAHFGPGGRGTKDCFIVPPVDSCQFPAEFEEDCGRRIGPCTNSSNCCQSDSGCYDFDGLPSVAGVPYTHSIYEIEFGAAGGDKGCRDGDGHSCMTAGAGGGRIVLAALDALGTGSLAIAGKVTADGRRGCGDGNDSAGGGAGGSILLVGDQVTVSAGASVSAAGGLGGDTQGHPDCPPCAQKGGVCDDCGGGGGGGIISVLSGKPAALASLASFNVAGAEGGTCDICKGEAGGGAGELQLSGLYVGEVCDGYDNDFDGQVDEGLGDVTCGSSPACQTTVPLCNTTDPNNVFVNDCTPLDTPDCKDPLVDSRSRFLVIVDSSGSMLTDLGGTPTFGDGSAGHLGLDTDGNGHSDDSRLYKAKRALTQVIAAYPEIDFGLARFSQDVRAGVNCQLAHWFECAGICCTYDDPTNNSGGTPPAGPCSVSAGAAGVIQVQPDSPGDECINYAGNCGRPRRGADILVGFGRPLDQKLMWLDHQETSFDPSTTPGDHCNFAGGGDCELRGTGPTPLAGSLHAAKDHVAAEQARDPVAFCRRYAVILLTDGAETCGGDPVAAAAELLADTGVETFVVGFSVLAAEQAALNAIAQAGSVNGQRNAFFAGNESQLASTLATIVADSVRFEKCNDLDDDCDGEIDEDFPLKGQPCDNGKLGACFRSGVYVCAPDGEGVVCNAPDATGTEEICNGIDDDCDGQVDEDIPGGCIPCVPQPEVCNGLDDDCDGEIDEDIPSVPCGKDEGECSPGMTKCENGLLICDGGTGPTDEVCDGLDNDCDGIRDGLAETCYPFDSGCDLQTGICQGQCRLGMRLCTAEETSPGVWQGSWSGCTGAVGPSPEVCDGIDNDCDGELDEEAECPGESQCIEGQCTRSCAAGEFVCPPGQICKDGWCRADACDRAACAAQGEGFICKAGECVDACLGVSCPKYERCVRGGCVDDSCFGQGCPQGERCVQGQCVADPCSGVSCGAGTFCLAGSCVPLCDALDCPAGQRCELVDHEGGRSTRCVADPCAGKACDQGQVCKDGACIADECSTLCDKDQVCFEGACVADLCAVVRCPAGYHCEVGLCLVDSGPRREVLASGAGGCACSVGEQGSGSRSGATLALVLLGLLGLGTARPRPASAARRRRRLLLAVAGGGLLLVCTVLGGCEHDPLTIPLDDSGAVDADAHEHDAWPNDTRPPDAGPDAEAAPDLSYDACIALPELCNNVDDNCNGEIDEGYDRLNDPRYCEECKGCAHLVLMNAIPACDNGKCVIAGCAGGYVDLNKKVEDGCEYACTATGPEICDGIDNDCDGEIDEGVAASQNTCQQIGACQGAKPVCRGKLGWVCDYGPLVELQPCAKDEDCGAGVKCDNHLCAGQVINDEQRCDGADGDCDGVADDPWTNPDLPNALGKDCSPDDGKLGICRTIAEYACNAAGDGVACTVTQAGQPKKDYELCNGLDDDCDGKVDEVEDDAAGAGVVDDLIHVSRTVGGVAYDFYIYAHEASRPDATALTAGVLDARSCSRPMVQPWSLVSQAKAAAACAAAGMRLCTGAEWRVACEGSLRTTYPYGSTYQPLACNGYDAKVGGPLPTGGAPCEGGDPGLFDMSGNLREWTSEQRGTTSDGRKIYVVRGGAYHTPAEGLSCSFDLSQAVGDVVLPAIGFRCCSNSVP